MNEVLDELKIEPAQVTKTLCEFIRSELRKAGMSKVVIGLSGGVDSAATAFLAKEALGAQDVLAVLMPYRTTDPVSIGHGTMVLDILGVESVLVDITPMIDAYLEMFPDADRIRRGNIMARQRMIVLYDQSVRVSGLVLGTGNRTEYLLGYTTLWGDMACGINAIGCLYKTQVWQLARYLGVPKEIIDKRPSADLWQGQTDEGELGFTYEQADECLYYLVDRDLEIGDLVAKGWDRALVERIINTVQKNEFKRRMPLMAKLSY